MDVSKIAESMINFIRGRGYKTVKPDVVQEIPIQYLQQEEESQKPVRHPKRKARLFLAKYGIDGIYTQDDVNRVFWEMAIRRKAITKDIIHAVHVTICDDRLMKSFNRKLELYNKFMEAKASDPSFKENEKELKAEVTMLKQAITREEKEKNTIKQKLEQEEGMGRRLAKKFINQLKTPNSRFQQSYDFIKEEDIEEFLSWFKLLKRQVAKRTIKGIIRNHLPKEEMQELFLEMVEAHNAQFQPDSDETELNPEHTDTEI